MSEWKQRAIAVPAAFLIALAFHAWETGHWLQRTFLTMVPHELGHAITGWWSGFVCVPTVWKTSIPDERSTVAIVIVAAAAIALVVLGWQRQKIALWASGLAVLLGEFILAGQLSNDDAHAAITFGGDGGAMILGTALVLLFFVPRLGSVRWGLLAIGAATLVDTSATWLAARHDPDVIPFGEIEGVGLSDPSKLQEIHGWTSHQIADRYAALALACFVVVAGAWLVATWTTRRDAP